MDVLDSVTHYPRVDEYIIMAADADYTPLVIRLRKHMKTTVVYAAMETSAAYRAACDSIIDERSLLELLEHDDEEIGKDNAPAPSIAGIQLTPRKGRRCSKPLLRRVRAGTSRKYFDVRPYAGEGIPRHT